ncbi:MAG: hypothetical protein Q9165_005651 [Trypethelium subeluteriae]
MGRPRKKQRQEDKLQAGPNAQYPTPELDHQDAFFELAGQGQYLTPNDDLGRHSLDNLAAEYFGASPAFLNAFNPPIDPSLDFSSLPFDPDLLDTSAVQVPNSVAIPDIGSPCSCLTNIYLILSELRTYSGCSFPLPLPTLRKSMVTAEQVLTCEECPKDFSTASQNLHMSCALLGTIGNGFRQLLKGIEQEAAVAEARGEKKALRVGDMNVANSHLHTGTLDCPMGFNVEVAASEWRELARKAVIASFDGANGATSLMDIVQKLEDRQRARHFSSDVEHYPPVGTHHSAAENECEDPVCVRMVTQTRQVIEVLAADIRPNT